MAKKPGRPRKFTLKQVIQAIDAGKTLTDAARILGCSRQTVYAYAQRYPAVAKALYEAREDLVDLAETALYKAVERGEPWAITFTLKTLGRRRGFSERLEVARAEEVTLELIPRIVTADRATQAETQTGT